jgi:hypothetical protein
MQMTREGSGTAWLPDTTPMYALHWQRGPWQFMAHENAFVQVLHESGDRGSEQFGSINWMMGMAQRNVGSGRVRFQGMFSAEPWTIRGCGYPDLLASGEQCKGEKIHDRQHPHDLLMEISAEYDAPLKGAVRWQVYGGPAGEPALGPWHIRIAYPPCPTAGADFTIGSIRRTLRSASHWLALCGRHWKAKRRSLTAVSPMKRTNGFLRALDSFSGRLWFLHRQARCAVSAGRLTRGREASGERRTRHRRHPRDRVGDVPIVHFAKTASGRQRSAGTQRGIRHVPMLF